jgi:hypothetical protein
LKLSERLNQAINRHGAGNSNLMAWSVQIMREIIAEIEDLEENNKALEIIKEDHLKGLCKLPFDLSRLPRHKPYVHFEPESY